jgi:Superfamily II DNA/RNA helicases, SNF2 family
MTDLYPFQEEAVQFHLKHRYTLNCSEMGLGKTRMALTAAIRSNEPVLVFGPAFLKNNWLSELAAIKGKVPMEYVAYSQLHKFRPKDFAGFGFWIADECHYLKNPLAKRTQSFMAFLDERQPKFFVGLTGTPVRNRVPDFWTLLAFCGADDSAPNGLKLKRLYPRYHEFASHFCHVDIRHFGQKQIRRYTGIKAEKVDELKSLLRDKFIRFRVDQVLKDLPEIVRKVVNFNLKPTPGLEDLFLKYIAGHKIEPTGKALSALTKAPHTVEYVKDLLENGAGPLVVFTDHVESAKAIASAIPEAQCITGQMLPTLRAGWVEMFQAGQLPVIVATIGSLSVGVTLTAARHLIFNDLSWIPSDNLQAEKRIHRIGQRNTCFIHYMEATETDAIIRKTLHDKLAAIEAVVT